MKKSRTILIACVLASCLGASPVVAQQNQEQTAAYYFDHGEFAQAAQLYEGLYKRTTNKYYYQRLLATYMELGEYRDAIATSDANALRRILARGRKAKETSR